jgi:hypothetical protein
MSTAILLLSDLSYSLGLIGLSEMSERVDVAEWLANIDNILPDPRGIVEDREVSRNADRRNRDQTSRSDEENDESKSGGKKGDDPEWMRLIVLNKWHFTLGDADCVPSVPHGHENSKTQSWPKLNPYTGRVFTDVQQEDVSKRLDRHEMQTLWRDESFVERCRRQVIWYANSFPAYAFANARRGRLHFPRW